MSREFPDRIQTLSGFEASSGSRPMPAELAPDVIARVARNFPGDDGDLALAVLSDVSHMSPRIQRCVVFLSERDLERLAHYTEQAIVDYRDVILWAEYENIRSGETPRQVRDFTLPFDQARTR